MRSLLVLFLLPTFLYADEKPWLVFSPPRLPEDSRLKPFHLDNPYPFHANYTTKEAWEKRADALRLQLKIAMGLHPMPEKTPLNAVVHGKRDMGDYTVEKVYFASMPGHYVCGNLYRPKDKAGKLPVVLNPHGHFAEGRFTKESDNTVKRDLASKGEEREAGARFPLQAAAVGICRLGCIVFHYDMVGYADTTQPIPHRVGFNALNAELNLQSFFGLQTWNSIRALDFVCDLPEVDTKRIAVTGASGGGTQTFILCAIDPRPTVSFPAVMVSGNMQGGCICENASLTRLGTNNIEIAALFAPKPQAMTGANDWTRDIETKGLPELKKIYGLYGAADQVNAKYYPFPHNYNQVCREMIYDWFNTYLKLGLTGQQKEKAFAPLSASELSVFDDDHPRPKDWMSAQQLQTVMKKESDKQVFDKHLHLPDGGRALQLEVLPHLCGTSFPAPGTTKAKQLSFEKKTGYDLWKGTQTSITGGEEIPLIALVPPKDKQSGVAVVWVDAKGKAALFKEDGSLTAPVQKLIDSGATVVSADTFLTGEWHGKEPTKTPMVPQKYHKDVPFLGYWLGYNRSIAGQRVHDLLLVIGHLKQRKDVKEVWLIATGDAEPWACMAAILADKQITKVAMKNTPHDFDFATVDSPEHPMMLPGGLKYFKKNDLWRLVNHTVLQKPEATPMQLVDALLGPPRP